MTLQWFNGNVAVLVLGSVLVRWGVSLNSYSGKTLLSPSGHVRWFEAVSEFSRQCDVEFQARIRVPCLETTKRRDTGWKSRFICRSMTGEQGTSCNPGLRVNYMYQRATCP